MKNSHFIFLYIHIYLRYGYTHYLYFLQHQICNKKSVQWTKTYNNLKSHSLPVPAVQYSASTPTTSLLLVSSCLVYYREERSNKRSRLPVHLRYTVKGTKANSRQQILYSSPCPVETKSYTEAEGPTFPTSAANEAAYRILTTRNMEQSCE